MNGLITALAARLFDTLWPYLEKELDKLIPQLTEKALAMLPVIVAAMAKAMFERIPNMPNIEDVGELAEEVRKQVNQIPDIDIPILSDIFDLSEMFNPHK